MLSLRKNLIILTRFSGSSTPRILLATVVLVSAIGCSSPVEPVKQIVPLFFRGEEDGKFRYRSHTIEAAEDQPASIYTNKIYFDNWECEWIATSDGSVKTVSSTTPAAKPLQSKRPFRIDARLKYTGSLNLSIEALDSCRPRLLSVEVQSYGASSGPLNAVIVLVDAMRPDHFPGRKYPFIVAPHLENMRGLGTEFTRWYGTSSSSRPSIGSIFTGLYPRAHGAIRHTTEAASLFPKAKTIAELYQEQGYRTGAFHSNAQIVSPFGFSRGFEKYEGPIWDPDVIRESLRWLSRTPPPFFLYVHFICLHAPYQTTEHFDDFYIGKTGDEEHDRYCAEITLVDQRVGQFLLGLAERDLLGSTLLWFLSDHGEEFLEHGVRYHGETLYDESVRTMSILAYPPLVESGKAATDLTSHVDVFPTLTQLFEFEVQSPVQGRYLFEDLAETEDQEIQRTVFAQTYGGAKSDPLVPIKEAAVQGRWKLIAPSWRKGMELYDLAKDPAESINLAPSHPEVVEDLLTELDRFTQSSDAIAEQLGRAEALEMEPVTLTPDQLQNLRDLGYIK